MGEIEAVNEGRCPVFFHAIGYSFRFDTLAVQNKGMRETEDLRLKQTQTTSSHAGCLNW